MHLSRIHRLYISNFLTGLVFWYGIEKLFMQSIGITAAGIGIVTAVFLTVTLILDIPSGIIADRWSRKGMLMLSAFSLALCSMILGGSHNLLVYALGDFFYGLYIVSTSGTYSAITYDILHEESRADQYSKIAGRAYALFLAGAGAANLASGFLAAAYGYRFTFYISMASCLMNLLIIASIREPTFHKLEHKERMLRQLTSVTRALHSIHIVRAMVIVLSGFSVIELFKLEFGQLYYLRYIDPVQVIGILWAIFAFAMSFGSVIAYKLRNHLNLLIICSVVPFIIMSFVDTWFSIILFMVQAVAAAAFINQTETRVQENTPSEVRASILSVVSTLGRIVSVPASFAIGWLVSRYDILIGLRCMAVLACVLMLYWFLSQRSQKEAT